MHDVALLIVETGMRPQEVFQLRAEDSNLRQQYLKVIQGKTRFARRNIPLTEAASELLKRRLAEAKGSYLFPIVRTVALMRERRGLIASLVAQRNQRSHFRCPACGYPASEQRNCRQQ